MISFFDIISIVMYQVFKSLIVSNIVVKNIDLYGCIVSINRRLSNDIVRKRLANCLVISRKHDKDEKINGIWFEKGMRSHWLGYLLHRDNDKPALMIPRGTKLAFLFPGITKYYIKKWYKYGKLHRDNDKPAYINNEWRIWYQHGNRHRDGDKPAYIYENDIRARREWWQHGKLHREHGLPAVTAYGGEDWYWQGELYKKGEKSPGNDPVCFVYAPHGYMSYPDI